MQADKHRSVHAGRLRKDVHPRDTMKRNLVCFIASQLPLWRNDPERPSEEAETRLTSQLRDFLNKAARTADGWSHIQFRAEVPDESAKVRTIDLAPALSGDALIIEGRRHTCYDTIFPIECKRLPTPTGSNRDQREYVHTANGTTGGIQRFKSGFHGKAHRFGAMIAYVQDRSFTHWSKAINGWIDDMAQSEGPPWSKKDRLHRANHFKHSGLCRLQSTHSRVNDLGDIELHHLWITMP